MYIVSNYERGKTYVSFDTLEDAQADAQRRANRYKSSYCITWFEPNTGTMMQKVTPTV